MQAFFCQTLKNDAVNYQKYTSQLKEEVPSDEAEEQREKELKKEREEERLK